MRFVVFLSLIIFALITVARPQVSAEGRVCLDCHSSPIHKLSATRKI